MRGSVRFAETDPLTVVLQALPTSFGSSAAAVSADPEPELKPSVRMFLKRIRELIIREQLKPSGIGSPSAVLVSVRSVPSVVMKVCKTSRAESVCLVASLMIDEAEAEAEAAVETDLPAFSPAQFHPVVWSAAAAHWTNHQYRVAVREAAEALNVHWKDRVGRNDVDDTPFWQQTLSAGEPSPGKPKLAWPGTPTDKTTKSMRGGLEPLAAGSST
ncbi:TIGR02391 family protein [Kitasatospora sp. NPDC056184]|uniref:TIGR02391 family protein n=1 Tax=Kitasatospora sp. NPDC056184 TaxID=3345738 RepID=UPI0035DB55E3